MEGCVLKSWHYCTCMHNACIDFYLFHPQNKLPSHRSGYGHRETPDLWSAPVQDITISESSQLSSISQLRRSHSVSPLHVHLQIALTQSWDYANVLHNLKIGTQFLDSENVQCNLKIAQISRLRGTCLPTLRETGASLCWLSLYMVVYLGWVFLFKALSPRHRCSADLAKRLWSFWRAVVATGAWHSTSERATSRTWQLTRKGETGESRKQNSYHFNLSRSITWPRPV